MLNNAIIIFCIYRFIKRIPCEHMLCVLKHSKWRERTLIVCVWRRGVNVKILLQFRLHLIIHVAGDNIVLS